MLSSLNPAFTPLWSCFVFCCCCYCFCFFLPKTSGILFPHTVKIKNDVRRKKEENKISPHPHKQIFHWRKVCLKANAFVEVPGKDCSHHLLFISAWDCPEGNFYFPSFLENKKKRHDVTATPGGSSHWIPGKGRGCKQSLDCCFSWDTHSISKAGQNVGALRSCRGCSFCCFIYSFKVAKTVFYLLLLLIHW